VCVCICRFFDRRDAEDALELDNVNLSGRRIGVQFAKYGALTSRLVIQFSKP
jgi:RNA recognition motif-containing protein